MVTEFTFKVKAVKGGVLPWFPGYETRGAFLEMIKAVDEELAKILHDGVVIGKFRRSLFSLKCLRLNEKVKFVYPEGSFVRFAQPVFPLDANQVFEPNARGWFRVVILNDDYVTRILNDLHQIIFKPITIKDQEFMIDGIELNVLDLKGLFYVGELSESVDVYFVTPTYFNPLRGDQRYKLLYPDVEALVVSIATMVYNFGKDVISLEEPEKLAEYVYVSGIDIKSPLTKSEKQSPTGFVGWAKLKFKKDASDNVRQQVLGLLRIAEHVNLGGDRSAGYGEVVIRMSKEV
ncbi:MAG: CRISPR system precrRNA processing endoribonuclease RAMP protein Cas6 [Thermoprotei archaeon]|jgi:CRISPR-associated endoribonuclease Cas6